MAITKIEFDISGILSPEDEVIISDCLGITSADLQLNLNNVGKVAFLEFIKMFTENGVPSKSAEILEQRLFLLMLYYYKDNLPTESEIGKVFQITSTQSRSLLRNTMSKYRIPLTKHLKSSIKKSLTGTNYRNLGDMHYFTISSDFIKNTINEHIKEKRPDLDRLVNNVGSSGEYKCNADTYGYLKTEFGL